MPNTTEVDEAEIAKLVSDGGLKPETLARRKRVRASFQAFTLEHYEKSEETTEAEIRGNYPKTTGMYQNRKYYVKM